MCNRVKEHVYTVFFAFAGIGGGAIGFQQAAATLAKFGLKGRFRVIGAFDFDAGAAADFERLTGVPCEVVDVRELTVKRLRALCPRRPDVVFGSAPCLPADALVLTEAGPRRIDSIRAGDRVLSHAGRYCTVRQVGTHRHVGTMVSLRTNGSPVAQSFTDEHPMWVRKPIPGETRSRGEATFLPAAKVEVGDWIGFPIQSEVAGTARRFVDSFGDPRLSERGGHHEGERYAKPRHTAFMETRVRDLRALAENPALWFLIGAYLGDGYRRIEEGRYEIIYCLGHAESRKAVAVRAHLTELGLTWSEDRAAGDTNIKLRLHSKHLHTILGAFGDGAEEKFIPEALMTLELPLLDAFLAGYRITDGSDVAARVNASGRRYPAGWKIPSVSLPLLQGVQRLLLRMGVFGAIHCAWPGGPQEIMGRTVQTKPRWEIRVQLGPRRKPGFVLEGATLWTRVQKVEHRAADEDVWNLEVDGDDTFCVHLMATHNCKGASPLLGNELAETEKYQEMNELMLVWTELMLAAWGDDPPLLVINENVPRLASRAKDTVKEVVKLHQRHGYVVHAGSHDCGEVGGLAQHRVRFLLVARLARKVTSFLYQPPKQRVRGCGEVIGPLPLPSDPAGGDMHILTDICVTNWIRLALIPPGGDWRNIEGALQAHEARNAHWSRYHTARFDLATPVVAGSGSNGAFGVGDERVSPRSATGFVACTIPGLTDERPLDVRLPVDAYPLMYGVRAWPQASVTITGKASPTCGAFTLADPRMETPAFRTVLGVVAWTEPSHTLTSRLGPSNGAFTVDDLRVPAGTFRGAYGVLRLDDAAGAVTSAEGPSMGRFAVADERVSSAVRAHAYHFTNELMLAAWWRPSRTVTGATHLGNGSGAVEDVRVPGNRYGMNWRVEHASAPAHTIIGVTDIQAGAPSYPDVRVPPSTFLSYGVLAFSTATGAITGNHAPGGGSFSVVDVRLTCEVRENSGAYGVLLPARPAYTVTAWGDINNGRFAYADPRDLGVVDGRRDVAVILVGMLAPEAPDFTVDVEARVELPTTPATEVPKKRGRRRVRRVAAPCGRVRRRGGRGALFEGVALVADPRVPRNPSLAVRFWATRLDQPPLFVPVLATPSGYWHRPLTVWERFALQGFPLYDGDGRAIVLSGANISDWSERIGNAVPPPTAKAVAEQMLLTLLHAEAGVFVLSSGGGAWVQPGRAPRWMRVLGVEDLIPRAKRASRKVVARCGGFAPVEPGDPWASLVTPGLSHEATLQ